WTHIMYKDQDGYIKSEFVTEISEEEYQEGPIEEEEKEEEKKDEKKEEGAAQTKEEAEKKAAEDAAKAAADAEKAAQEALAAQQEAIAAAAAAAPATYTLSGVPVTATQYNNLLNMFRFATPNGTDAEAKAEVEIHSGAEIKAIIQDKGW
nr:hypothetical protein [Lachnospiraceae bacterium]